MPQVQLQLLLVRSEAHLGSRRPGSQQAALADACDAQQLAAQQGLPPHDALRQLGR